jgi:hypothetical protein
MILGLTRLTSQRRGARLPNRRRTLWLDTSDDPATGCDLQLLAGGLNPLKEGGMVLPQIGFGNVLGSSD